MELFVFLVISIGITLVSHVVLRIDVCITDDIGTPVSVSPCIYIVLLMEGLGGADKHVSWPLVVSYAAVPPCASVA